MELQQQQHQRDEESVDQEREASHPLHAQAMPVSKGYTVSVATPLSRLVFNDMSQFQRLASLHGRLVAARTKFQLRGGQPGQDREPEPEATQVDVAVEAQTRAIGAAEAQAQAIGTVQVQATGAVEAQAQAMVSATDAPPQGIEGGQRDTQASPFFPLCRSPRD